MNILVIGPYRDNNDLGRLCRETIFSLATTDANIGCKPLSFTPNSKTNDAKLRELEEKVFFDGLDVVIQCMPPFMMEYNKLGGLNVGLFDMPTLPIPKKWINYTNLLDLNLFDTPVGCDTSVYNKEYPKLKELEEISQDRFLFYSMGEYTRKSGFTSTIRAFVTEFKFWEQVGLVINTSREGINSQDVLKTVVEHTNEAKEMVGIQNSPPIIVLSNNDSNSYNHKLHNICDCYISANYGLDWDYNAFDAMGFGKTPIYNSFGRRNQYLNKYCGYPVKYSLESVYAAKDEKYTDAFTSENNWGIPDVIDLAKQMRLVFENSPNIDKANYCKKNINNFDYATVGKELLRVLQNGKKILSNH